MMNKHEEDWNGAILFAKTCQPNSSSKYIQFLFVAVAIMLERHTCSKQSCDFVIHNLFLFFYY